ncbi:MAG: XdhC family protein [Rhodospirillaceae bacterium]
MSTSNSESGAGEDGVIQALRWLDAGRRVALAMVMTAWDGAACAAGSVLVVAENGDAAGSVSRGCIEESVIGQALRAIADGEQRLLTYCVADAVAREQAGLEGGGRIEVLLEPLDPGGGGHRLLGRAATARAEGRPVALVADLITGMKTLVYPHAVHGGFGLDAPVLAAVRRCLAEGRSAVLEPGEESRLFVQVFGVPGAVRDGFDRPGPV